MEARPITDRCEKNLQKRVHVCFGVSPFNSYFTEPYLQELARWGQQEFQSMHFFVPDRPSIYTLEALGYPPEKASWKARRQNQYLQNKILRALKNQGISEVEGRDMILNWEKLALNEKYLAQYERVQERFENDNLFRQACLEASRWVLEKRVPDTQLLTYDVLASAARYLLAEIPLFVDSVGILDQSSSIFCYHQCVPFLDNLFHNQYGIHVSDHQGFAVLAQAGVEPNLEEPSHSDPDIQVYQECLKG